MSASVKEIARRFIQAWNAGQRDIADGAVQEERGVVDNFGLIMQLGIADGAVQEERGVVDNFGLIMQLGAAPKSA